MSTPHRPPTACCVPPRQAKANKAKYVGVSASEMRMGGFGSGSSGRATGFSGGSAPSTQRMYAGGPGGGAGGSGGFSGRSSGTLGECVHMCVRLQGRAIPRGVGGHTGWQGALAAGRGESRSEGAGCRVGRAHTVGWQRLVR